MSTEEEREILKQKIEKILETIICHTYNDRHKNTLISGKNAAIDAIISGQQVNSNYTEIINIVAFNAPKVPELSNAIASFKEISKLDPKSINFISQTTSDENTRKNINDLNQDMEKLAAKTYINSLEKKGRFYIHTPGTYKLKRAAHRLVEAKTYEEWSEARKEIQQSFPKEKDMKDGGNKKTFFNVLNPKK